MTLEEWAAELEMPLYRPTRWVSDKVAKQEFAMFMDAKASLT